MRIWREWKMSEIKLKPCPFCGGGAAIGRHGDNYFIECCKCGSRTWFYKSADKATEAWNRRVGEQNE